MYGEGNEGSNGHGKNLKEAVRGAYLEGCREMVKEENTISKVLCKGAWRSGGSSGSSGQMYRS